MRPSQCRPASRGRPAGIADARGAPAARREVRRGPHRHPVRRPRPTSTGTARRRPGELAEHRAGAAAVDDPDRGRPGRSRPGHPDQPSGRPPPGASSPCSPEGGGRRPWRPARRRDAWLARRLAELTPRRAGGPRRRHRDPEEDRRLVSPTFRSLHIPNYRLWAVGALVSNTGTWMQRVAQDWLVLTVLTRQLRRRGRDHDRAAVRARSLLLAPVAGAVADRLDRRRVLMATQAAVRRCWRSCWACSCVGTPRSCGTSTCSPRLLGVVAAFDGPARQAFVSEMVARGGPAERGRPQQRLVPRRPADRARDRRPAHPLARAPARSS